MISIFLHALRFSLRVCLCLGQSDSKDYRHWVVIAAIALLPACSQTQHIDPTASQYSFKQLVQQKDRLALSQYRQSTQLLTGLLEKEVFFEQDEFRAVLERVEERLFSPQERQKIHVRFSRLPGENAFALPTGDIIIYLSMMAALQNEEQLAFVLAHEYVHVLKNHAWVSAGNRRNNRIVAHLSDLLTLGSGVTYPYFAQSVQQFSRQQELDADRLAVDILYKAGYDIRKASGFFDLLNQYPTAPNSTVEMRSHPSNSLRKELITDYLNNKPQVSLYKTEAASYSRLRTKLLKQSISDKIEEQDFPGALVQIADLEGLGERQQTTECLRGDVYLALSRNDAESERAMREATGVESVDGAGDFFVRQAALSYAEVLKIGSNEPCALRGLGLAQLDSGNIASSKNLLRAYLNGEPPKDQRRHIEWLIGEEAL